ncbi:thioredoxin [Aerococcaceae bacterium DSM 109653]|uniref:Thioredoxin n=1 Tax=Fundicoccus ignavus TaxID=2664442 RepID=A0A844BLL0_9LACT|nr:thioredoxin domain-containing protein [Fundicoccus ignavus]MRI82770.1 thioredoxin [Fundicoccus ignavus]
MLKEMVREEFEQDIAEGSVLLDFYSKTCGPCKMLAFVLQDVEKQFGDDVKIIKIDFEENPDLIEKYNVEGYPTLIMFKDGVELSRKAGLQQKPVIIKMIEESL